MVQKIPFRSESTLAQQCYEQLQAEIVEGILKPGEKLKVGPIKERLGMVQSPVREALCRLVAFGLVDVEDNKGFRVSTISEADIRDIYATFTYIENRALALAIKHGDDAWEASLVAALHKLGLIENNRELGSYAQWAERNYEFHVALIAGCNSSTLLEIRRNLYLKFDRYCRMAYQLYKGTLSLNHEEHKKMAEAALQRGEKKLLALMTYHINGALEEVIQKLKEKRLIA